MKLLNIYKISLVVVIMAFLAPQALAQDIEVIDNFEWAAGIDAEAYYDSLVSKGWEPRVKADAPGDRHPDLSISSQAIEGEYCLEITQQRSSDDYIKYTFPAGYADWSSYNYLSFWIKASVEIDAGSGAVKIYTRDFEQSWGKLDPVTVGTDWTYIVYELPEDPAMIDSLMYFRIFCRGDQGFDLPFKLWVDDVKVSVDDPRGPSLLLDDFEWGAFVTDNVIDSLRAHDWKTRLADYDSLNGWSIFPDYGLSDDAYEGKRALRMTAFREESDYIKHNYEFDDSLGVWHYGDWSDYNYLSFYMKGDHVISDTMNAVRVYLNDINKGWIKYDVLNVDTTYNWFVIDLNEQCTTIERENLRYMRLHCYSTHGEPIPYSTFWDYFLLTSWDPREPDSPITGVKANSPAATTPKTIELAQNYPNPFNPTTTISFALNKPAKVKLTVYNLLGRHVKTILNGNMAAGHHQVMWEGTNESLNQVPSGVYFYRLEADKHSMTRKMILLK